jgi:signal-transduction protein with cAMP-binding, CBS, and nucleotidyltransferase domain
MYLTNIMTTPLLSIEAEATAMQAAQVMAEHHVTSILVPTDTPTTGIVTQDDVLTCTTVPLNQIQVKDLPIQPTQRVNATLTCEDAIKLMIRRSCRKLIFTKGSQNIGLFTLENIMTHPLTTR